jgi:hypothetical protein
MVKLAGEEDILRQIEAASPQVALLVDLLRRRHRRGRPPIPERHYRQLMLWWRSFQRRQGAIPLETARAMETAWAKFQRLHGNQIAKLWGIKTGRKFRGDRGPKPNSFLNAVARGADEHDRIRKHRKSTWKILRPLGGTEFVTDPAKVAYLRAAEEAALLGKDPLGLFTFNSSLFK